MTDHDDDVPRTFRQADVEQTLLGEEAKYSRDQVAERAGVDLERAQQLWVAMGFPTDPDPDVVMYTDADVDAIAGEVATTDYDIDALKRRRRGRPHSSALRRRRWSRSGSTPSCALRSKPAPKPTTRTAARSSAEPYAPTSTRPETRPQVSVPAVVGVV